MATKRSEPLIEDVDARLRDLILSNVAQAGRYLADWDVANTGSRRSRSTGHEGSRRVLLNQATIDYGHSGPSGFRHATRYAIHHIPSAPPGRHGKSSWVVASGSK